MMLWRRRLVRLHLEDPHPSVEGILIGRVNGFYRLLKTSVIEAEDRSHPLDGEVWVPRERVILVQRL